LTFPLDKQTFKAANGDAMRVAAKPTWNVGTAVATPRSACLHAQPTLVGE
jgi:hypothetical protein